MNEEKKRELADKCHLFLTFVISLLKLLDALELSQSPLLLKLLAGVLCRDTKHIMEEQFQTCFQRIARRSVNPSSMGENRFCAFPFLIHNFAFLPSRSSSERQLQLLGALYDLIQHSNVPVISMMQAMMERVLLPLASHCSSKALSDFFVANIADIMAVLLMRFTKVCFFLSLMCALTQRPYSLFDKSVQIIPQ